MNINQIMSELAQYIRVQEEAAAMVEALMGLLRVSSLPRVRVLDL